MLPVTTVAASWVEAITAAALAADYGGDPAQLYLCGDSAGAYLCYYLAALQNIAGERAADIALIAQHLAQEVAAELGLPLRPLPDVPAGMFTAWFIVRLRD